MTVHLTQVYSCDLCGEEVRRLEQRVPAQCIPQIIQTDVTLKHDSTVVDVCRSCWPDIMEATTILRLKREADNG